MTEEQIDFWVVHVFGFILDLTVGFWMYFDKTRPAALLFLSLFHVMNSRLFTIGKLQGKNGKQYHSINYCNFYD